MSEKYELNICGIKRLLRKVPVSPELTIASFVMLGDTELVEKCADALAERLRKLDKKIDILVSPEAKGIPLAHALAVRLGLDYIVVRKTVKGYMENPLTVKVKSITTAKEQTLVIDGLAVDRLNGKNVAVIDDVVSTGGSLRSLREIVSKTGCNIVAEAAVLLEEAGYEDENLIYLERLPIFKTEA